MGQRRVQARKSDHRVYLLAKAAYGNARHADEARRAAEAVDPPSGHLFVEALDFRRAVHSDAEVADWIAVQSEIHLGADGDVWRYVRQVRDVREFLGGQL